MERGPLGQEAEGTTCDERDEAINNTKHCRILRVPFHDSE